MWKKNKKKKCSKIGSRKNMIFWKRKQMGDKMKGGKSRMIEYSVVAAVPVIQKIPKTTPPDQG